MSMNASRKLLQKQLKSLNKNPNGCFKCELSNPNNIYEWTVFLKGPGDTCYEGGIFKAKLVFPKNYPFEPPTMTFISDFWHPNVYDDGKVCISILHPPGEDEMSGERPEERWLPIHTPETILLSIISMLSDPNCQSAANVDASVMWRNKRSEYISKVKKLVDKSIQNLPKDFEIPAEKKPVIHNFSPYVDNNEFEYEVDEDDDDDDDDDDDMMEDDDDDDEYDGELSDLDEEDLKYLNEEDLKMLQEQGINIGAKN